MSRTAQFRFVLIVILFVAAPAFAETNASAQEMRSISIDPDSRRMMSEEMQRPTLPRPAPRLMDPGFRLADPIQVALLDSSIADGGWSIEREGMAPVSLGASDFNNDNKLDLVVGYRTTVGGVIALANGTGAISGSPFVEGATFFDTAEAPDFLATGDFDNDGHQDVVLGARGGKRLILMSGNGEGGLRPTRHVTLQGGITSMVAGEINRRDGLVDLAVGVDGESGPAVLVFEGPQGALRAEAERLALESTPTALALGQVDYGYERDLVIAAGTTVTVVHGRDRWLSLDEEVRQKWVGPLSAHRHELGAPIDDIAIGDFVWEPERLAEIAVLFEDGRIEVIEHRGPSFADAQGSCSVESDWSRVASANLDIDSSSTENRLLLKSRVTRTSMDDLLVLDGSSRQAHLFSGSTRGTGSSPAGFAEQSVTQLEGRPVAALSLRLNRDATRDLVFLHEDETQPVVRLSSPAATITVTHNADPGVIGDGKCTLREALNNANSDSDTSAGDCAAGAGVDNILFALTGGLFASNINVTSVLPVITDALVMDGTTQGCPNPPCVTLNGPLAGTGANGLELGSDGNTIRGLSISNFDQSGILIRSGDNILSGCFIGTNLAGTTVAGNRYGITIDDASDNVIGGASAGERNLVSGNLRGVIIQGAASSGNEVLGNYVGTDVSGTIALSGSIHGIYIDGASNNTVGGSGTGDGNLSSGNTNSGILVLGGGTGNLIQGNAVGLDVNDLAMGNGLVGIWIADSHSNTMGGTAVGAGNVASSNTYAGLAVNNEWTETIPEHTIVQGNLVGLDSTGTLPRPNGAGFGGLGIMPGHYTLVGGNVPEARNVAGSDGTACVWISGMENVIQGNYIGTDASGTTGFTSVLSFLIGEAPYARDTQVLDNLISSGNLGSLQLQFGATGTSIRRNLIGTDASGTAAIGSGSNGLILLGVNTKDNVIGSALPGEGNVIAGHTRAGILIADAPNNNVLGNRIGIDPFGAALPNTINGIHIADALNNVVGGSEPGVGNIIAFNGGSGVTITDLNTPATGNVLLGNSMFGNDTLGIDLADDGVTPNDLGDPDAGPNLLQNFPVLTSAEVGLSSTTITGDLNTMSGAYRIEFFSVPSCDSSGHGEGERFLGATEVTTDIGGNASFETTVLMPAFGGGAVTATATGGAGTSEFSQCLPATACAVLAPFGQMVQAPNPDELQWPAPADIRWVKGLLSEVGYYGTVGDGAAPAATSIDTSLDGPDPGDGFWYLVRPLACGSWQTAPGAQPGRDGGSLP